jgi:hypothetical protein
LEEKIEERSKIIKENKDENSEELNLIEKESVNKDSERSEKGSGLGKTNSRTKDYPHGYDKI